MLFRSPSAQPTPAGQPPGAAPGAPPGETSVTVTKTSDARSHLRQRAFHAGLLGLDPEGLKLGVPAVRIRPIYTPVELSQYGVEQRTEVDIPVFSASF